jgi:hypothetical protein
MNLVQQMANIGSEVNRALTWQKKGKEEFSRNAVIRALELLDLSLDSAEAFPSIKEFARLREAIVDYFICENIFKSSDMAWRRYFGCFERAARKGY